MTLPWATGLASESYGEGDLQKTRSFQMWKVVGVPVYKSKIEPKENDPSFRVEKRRVPRLTHLNTLKGQNGSEGVPSAPTSNCTREWTHATQY